MKFTHGWEVGAVNARSGETYHLWGQLAWNDAAKKGTAPNGTPVPGCFSARLTFVPTVIETLQTSAPDLKGEPQPDLRLPETGVFEHRFAGRARSDPRAQVVGQATASVSHSGVPGVGDGDCDVEPNSVCVGIGTTCP